MLVQLLRFYVQAAFTWFCRYCESVGFNRCM